MFQELYQFSTVPVYHRIYVYGIYVKYTFVIEDMNLSRRVYRQKCCMCTNCVFSIHYTVKHLPLILQVALYGVYYKSFSVATYHDKNERPDSVEEISHETDVTNE
jgi:hypothetical protein